MIKQKILEKIIENLPHGFALIDRNGLITEFNRAAEDITGFSKKDAIGKRYCDIFSDTLGDVCCLKTETVFRKSEDIESAEIELKRKNGEIITVSSTLFPIYDSDGYFMGGAALFRDISEQKKKERERKNILSMFAHDMKNPVVVAKGFLSRLLSNKAGDLNPEQREYCLMIEDEMNRIQELIMDFLQFSRFEAKEYTPTYSSFCLKSALFELIEQERVLADRKAVSLSIIVEQDPTLDVIGDKSMIMRVMSNLLDNAIKHSYPGGSVSIAVENRDDHYLISVQDNGVGIAADHMPFIFDAFYRAGKDSKGTGLGLFISRIIVEAHGGRIWARSALGEGSSFYFTLPKKPLFQPD